MRFKYLVFRYDYPFGYHLGDWYSKLSNLREFLMLNNQIKYLLLYTLNSLRLCYLLDYKENWQKVYRTEIAVLFERTVISVQRCD